MDEALPNIIKYAFYTYFFTVDYRYSQVSTLFKAAIWNSIHICKRSQVTIIFSLYSPRETPSPVPFVFGHPGHNPYNKAETASWRLLKKRYKLFLGRHQLPDGRKNKGKSRSPWRRLLLLLAGFGSICNESRIFKKTIELQVDGTMDKRLREERGESGASRGCPLSMFPKIWPDSPVGPVTDQKGPLSGPCKKQ